MSGYMFDRWRGHPIIAAALFIMSAIMFLIPFMSWLWILAAVLFILGIAEGWLDVGGNTLLVWVHGDRVGPYMNGLHFFFGLGAFLAPLIVAQTMKLGGGIQWAYWTLALLIFPLTVLFSLLPSPAIRKDPHADDSRGKNALLVLLISIFFFLHVGSEISFGGWIYSYAVKMGLAEEAQAAYLTSAFWGSLTLGRLLGVPVSTKLKPRAMILVDICGSLLACVVILVWARALAALWIGSILMGLSIASLFPTSINFAERNMHITGKITSWFLVGSSVGGMFFPWLIGQFFESRGPTVMVLVILCAFASALVLMAGTIFYVSQHGEYSH
jgi:FHS family Na+ dependent glucose MFS transporter 1